MSKTPRSEATRRHILDTALALFRKRGYAAATMREIAKSAGVAIGAAYYYYPSKEALVAAYYDTQQVEHEARCAEIFAKTSDPRERIGGVFHSRLDLMKGDKRLLVALFRTAADPESPVSIFAAETAELRRRAVALFREALEPAPLPDDAKELFATALWALFMGILLYFIHDDSARAARTRALVDDALNLVTSSAVLMGVAAFAPIREQIARVLVDAGLLEDRANLDRRRLAAGASQTAPRRVRDRRS